MIKISGVSSRSWPLWQQIVLALLGAVVFVGVMSGMLVRHFETAELQTLYQQHLKKFNILHASAMDILIAEDIPVLEDLMQRMIKHDTDIVSISITNESGDVLFQWQPATPAPDSELMSVDKVFELEGEYFGIMEVKWSVQGIYREIETHVENTRVYLGGLFSLLGVIIILLLNMLVIGPVRKINRQLDRIAAGDLSGRISLSSSLEMTNLAASVNQLAEVQQKQKTIEDELREANHEIKHLSRQNEMILKSAGEGIYGLDLEGRTTFINPAATRMIGWQPEELVGKPQHDILHHTRVDGSHYPREACPIYAAFRDCTVHHVDDEVFWRKDGSSFPVEYVSTPILEDGNPVGAVVIFRDITERKQAENRLRESEALKAAMLESGLDAIITIDQQGRVREFNPAAEETFGYSRSEALGENMSELIIPHVTRAAHYQGIEHYLATGEGPLLGQRTEVMAMHRDGSEIPVELAITPIRLENDIYFTAFLRDISERRRIEEDRSQALIEAEKASRAKSDFLAVMSHEIRTPLNAIIGTVRLCLDGDLDDEQRRYAETAASSSESLLTIINDILDFSKVEAGKLELEQVDFDLARLVESVVEMLAVRAHGKGIDIGSTIGPGVPETVHGDPGRLRQILMNLVGNAVKFTHEGGVTVSVAVADSVADQITLHFEIIDTGIGVSSEALGDLFSEFTQEDPSFSRKYGGTGLGLAISRRLVSMMRGEIGCDSVPGQGSTFFFTVSLDQLRQPEECSGWLQDVTSFGGLRALILDTSVIACASLYRQLAAWGVDVEMSTDMATVHASLLEAASRDAHFDVLFIDERMSAMSGRRLVESVRQDPDLGGIRVVVMTRFGTSRILSLSDIAADSHLSRPVPRYELYRCMANLIGKVVVAEGGYDSDPLSGSTAQSDGRRSGRILLVEDSQANQVVAVAILQKAGYKVDAVADGLEAVEAVCTLPYDLVLMDLAMPEMDGFEATAAIRKLPGDVARIPVIAMTANAMQGDRDRCFSAGMDDYITKPIDKVELFRVLDRWLPEDRDAVPARKMPLADGSDKLLDLSILRQLEEDTTKEAVPGMIEIFICEVHKRMPAIELSRREADIAALDHEVHALKSSAGTFGAVLLQQQAQHVEQACKAGDRGVALAGVPELLSLAQQSIRLLAGRYQLEWQDGSNHAEAEH